MAKKKTKANTTSTNPNVPSPSDLLRRLIYVACADRIYDLVSQQFIQVGAAAKRFSQSYGGVKAATDAFFDGEDPIVTVDAIDIVPGQGIVVEQEGKRILNRWTDCGYEAVNGDTSLFDEHIAMLFDRDAVAVRHFLDTLAFLVQRPGEKLAFATLIVGGQGIGKSLLGEMIRILVGKSASRNVEGSMLRSDFNGWLAEVIFVVVNEMTAVHGKALAARLKDYITSETLLVNQKGIPQYEINNRVNFMIFSNEADAAYLDADDRRYFVWRSRAAKQAPEYYARLMSWFEDEGKAHVRYALLHRDIAAFNPYAPPPRTAARDEMVIESMSAAERLLHDRYEAGEYPFDRDVCVVGHVAEALVGAEVRVTSKDVQNFLRDRIKAVPLGQHRFVHKGVVTKPRFWAIRDTEFWVEASNAQIVAHYLDGADEITDEPKMTSAPQPVRRTRSGNASMASQVKLVESNKPVPTLDDL